MHSGLQENSAFLTICWQKQKNGFKKIADELMFEYSNLGLLSIFKKFKSLLSSNIP